MSQPTLKDLICNKLTPKSHDLKRKSYGQDNNPRSLSPILKKSNRLSPDSLEDLMIISLNGGQSREWSLDRLETWMNY